MSSRGDSASSYPASAWRMTPVPGSAVSTRSSRSPLRRFRRRRRPSRVDRVADADSAAVVDAHPGRTGRDVEERVQDRPVGDRVEPSRIASVSRYGEATEPESRWSRPITTGAVTAPARTSSLIARPARAVAVAEPADPSGQPLEFDASRSELEPPVKERVVGEEPRELTSIASMSRFARERCPAERADPPTEERPDIGRDEAGYVNASSTPASRASPRRLLP